MFPQKYFVHLSAASTIFTSTPSSSPTGLLIMCSMVLSNPTNMERISRCVPNTTLVGEQIGQFFKHAIFECAVRGNVDEAIIGGLVDWLDLRMLLVNILIICTSLFVLVIDRVTYDPFLLSDF